MSNNKYPQEFKDGAIRQVINKGYSVNDVSKRLDASDNPLYCRVKKQKPHRLNQPSRMKLKSLKLSSSG